MASFARVGRSAVLVRHGRNSGGGEPPPLFRVPLVSVSGGPGLTAGPRKDYEKMTGPYCGRRMPRRSVSLAAHRGQQPFEVLTAWAARAQVRGHTRVALLHRGTVSGQFGVDVQHLHRLGASHVPRISAQEAVER